MWCHHHTLVATLIMHFFIHFQKVRLYLSIFTRRMIIKILINFLKCRLYLRINHLFLWLLHMYLWDICALCECCYLRYSSHRLQTRLFLFFPDSCRIITQRRFRNLRQMVTDMRPSLPIHRIRLRINSHRLYGLLRLVFFLQHGRQFDLPIQPIIIHRSSTSTPLTIPYSRTNRRQLLKLPLLTNLLRIILQRQSLRPGEPHSLRHLFTGADDEAAFDFGLGGLLFVVFIALFEVVVEFVVELGVEAFVVVVRLVELVLGEHGWAGVAQF